MTGRQTENMQIGLAYRADAAAVGELLDQLGDLLALPAPAVWVDPWPTKTTLKVGEGRPGRPDACRRCGSRADRAGPELPGLPALPEDGNGLIRNTPA